MTNISITLTTVLTDAIRDAISDLSECGIPVGIPTLDGYTRLRGVSDKNILIFMESLGASDRLLVIPLLGEDVTLESNTSLVLDSLDKLRTGELTCIHMQELIFQALTQRSEWLAAQPEDVL